MPKKPTTPNTQNDEQGDVAIKEAEPQVAPPPKYAVLLHNDDYTTMDFVIEVLMQFFKKNKKEAYEITMKVHSEGKGLAGIYSKEIAEMKVIQVTEYARSHNHPLRCTSEPLA